jgi:alpha-galactosidase
MTTSRNNLLRTLKAATTTTLWVALTIVFASSSPAAAADSPTGTPQIQGGNLRIEFDNHLRSRVVARFGKTETVMGPFTASEIVTTANRAWTGFLLTSQKHGRTKDAFGEGDQLTVEGKSQTLTKIVTVTVYDDFPAIAFFDVQYTNAGTFKLAINSWTNNAYMVNAQSSVGAPAFWSYQSGSYEKRPDWIVPLHANFSAGELSRHECRRLWWRHAACRCLAA